MAGTTDWWNSRHFRWADRVVHPRSAGTTADHRLWLMLQGTDCRPTDRIFRKKSELLAAGNSVRLGSWPVTGLWRGSYAATVGQALLLRDHASRRHCWNDRGLRDPALRGGSTPSEL